ncbi:MAG TPA: winged helix-turn-helix transcriptional regulator [Candidatus Thermoplasmatota archaeon]
MHSYPTSSDRGEIPHLRFAYELIDEAGGLSQRLMRDLSGRPRRFAELDLVHGGRGTPELTDTLVRLEHDGLIEKRTSQREVAVVHTFELTAMGAQAEAEMQRLRPVQEIPRGPPKRGGAGRRFASTRAPGWVLPPKSRE